MHARMKCSENWHAHLNSYKNHFLFLAAMASKRREHVSFTWLPWLPAMATMAATTNAMTAMATIVVKNQSKETKGKVTK